MPSDTLGAVAVSARQLHHLVLVTDGRDLLHEADGQRLAQSLAAAEGLDRSCRAWSRTRGCGRIIGVCQHHYLYGEAVPLAGMW